MLVLWYNVMHNKSNHCCAIVCDMQKISRRSIQTTFWAAGRHANARIPRIIWYFHLNHLHCMHVACQKCSHMQVLCDQHIPPQNIFTLKILLQNISTLVGKYPHFQIHWGFQRCMFFATTKNCTPLTIWRWIGNKFQYWLQDGCLKKVNILHEKISASVKMFQTKVSPARVPRTPSGT